MSYSVEGQDSRDALLQLFFMMPHNPARPFLPCFTSNSIWENEVDNNTASQIEQRKENPKATKT